MYTVSIGCVDGETDWSIRSSRKLQLIEFLKEYDHEGSSIAIHIDEELPSGTHWVTDLFGEDVYKFLDGTYQEEK